MKREIIHAAAVSALLLAGLASCTESIPTTEEPTAPEAATTESAAYKQGTVNVFFSEELTEAIERDLAAGGVVTKASSPELSELYGSLGIESMERLFPDAGEYEPRTRAEGLHRWYKVKYRENKAVTKAAREIGEIPGVEIAEPQRNVRITSYFNDVYSRYQWDFYNDGTLTSSHLSGADINVVPVWKNYTTGDRSVIVSVVDGGIDYSHQDLADNYVGGYNFVSNSKTIKPHEHGTHVAGTIGAVNNNGIGINGIAGGDYAKGIKGVGLLSCQVFEEEDGSDTARAIKWGADNGAVISQNSWGYYYDDNDDGELTGSELRNALDGEIDSADKAAVDYFIKYAGCDNSGNQLSTSPMKGGVVIFAAGNDGIENGAPANYEPIIAVGSIGPNGQRAYYSNYGDWVDIAAPGGDYHYKNGQILSTVPNNKYDWMQGTSMSCPHVSGVAALIVSYFGGQGFTNDMLIERLIGGANTDAVSSGSRIGPLMDAMGSFTYGNEEENNPPVISTDYSGSYSVRAHEVLTIPFNISDPDGNSVSVKYTAGTSGADTFSKNASSGQYELKITGYLGDPGKYTAHILASDKWSTTDYPVDFEILENHPPVVLKNVEDMILDAPGSKFSLDMSKYVNDPDGETLKYKVTVSDVSVLRVSQKDNSLNGSALGCGTVSVTVKATDIKDKYCELTFRVAVPDPDKPVTAYPNPVTDVLKVGTGAAAQTEIVVISETGRKVYEDSSVVSILDPAEIDMSAQAPGRYVVKVTVGGKEYKQTIVKK